MAVTYRSVTSRTISQHIESITHHSVFSRTIQRSLQQSGLSAIRPLLSLPWMQNHRRLRCQWCDERRMWVAEGNEVVFTDESRICLQNHDGRIRVWRHRGEEILNNCVMHRHTGSTPGIMVWGGIGYHSRTLVCITGTLNSQRYICEVSTAIFQQDNARVHVARIVQRFFVNYQIELLSWTSRIFPDRKNMVHGCSTINPDFKPSCHTRSTLATRGSCLVCCTPRTNTSKVSLNQCRGVWQR
ncbi:transposable element Tcb1 transposase [Trichonephila clavipes]|nr:transposable element Tcb1 transposase [Trichonephila clavipes]